MAQAAPRDLFQDYPVEHFYDEMFAAPAEPRASYRRIFNRLTSLGREELVRRHHLAERSFKNNGITFTVYADDQGTEQIFPFDLVPRIIPRRTWQRLEQGLAQRVRALNLFLEDIYHERRILRDRAIPAEVVLSSPLFLPELCGFPFPRQLHAHVGGIDLVRDQSGNYLVLEDNVRTPSGISYVLANRQVLKRTCPDLFTGYRVRPVDTYPHDLLETLRWLARGVDDPTVVLLTPGLYNSAYFEHLYLAKQMGVELVEGRDLVVDQDRVFMRTTRGLKRVHVIYRRLDDDYLDPLFGRVDTLLGVPGLMNAYRAGNVALANAPGNGVADDKAVHAYVPDMIRYYLGEDALIPNVPTLVCALERDRRETLRRLPELVVKRVDGSGGHGLVIGPAASRRTLEALGRAIEAHPRDFIAQPVIPLSVQPAFDGRRLSPCHQDLRPFVLCGEEIRVTPGGLTRVALRSGSLVVNSSQGGGSRDTWVLAGDADA
ncbi:MAG: circularly permuted type 2 ATP-grasp protein [Candidatus Dormibacteria bacterium]